MASRISSLIDLFFSIPYLDILASFFPILNPYLSSSTSSIIGDICRGFYQDHADARKYVILAIEYHRCLDHLGFWHDYLVFDSAAPPTYFPNPTPHQPNTSQDNLTHTYLTIKRTTCLLGWGIRDEVHFGQDKPPTQQGSDECLGIFSWPSKSAFQPEHWQLFDPLPPPNLLDVLEVIQLLSLIQPKKNFTVHQCQWFSQAIIIILFHIYGFHSHVQDQLSMKIFHTEVPSIVLEIAKYKKWCTDIIRRQESEGMNDVTFWFSPSP